VTPPAIKLRVQELVFPKTNFAAALPTERIEQDLLELGFSTCDIRSWFDHTEFPAIPFKSNQLCYFHEYARYVLNDPISPKNLAIVFEMNERIVRRNLRQGRQCTRRTIGSSSGRDAFGHLLRWAANEKEVSPANYAGTISKDNDARVGKCFH
jgi:hypothetical protein